MLWEKDNYRITDDKSYLNFDYYRDSLKTTYWASTRTVETMRKSLEKSIIFSMFHKDTQIGFVRVVSDFITFSWICDVYIEPTCRGKGLSKWLMECVLESSAGKTRVNMLSTSNASELYEKFGFTTSEYAMMKKNANIH